jgi:hypothetical protein
MREDQSATLRRITVMTAAAAAALNALLFVQAGVQQLGPGDFQGAVVSALAGLFPGSGLQPANHPPSPSPPGTGIVTTGGS